VEFDTIAMFLKECGAQPIEIAAEEPHTIQPSPLV
jgi:hypothetical protein